MKLDVIRDLTPIVLATIGGIAGILVIFSPETNDSEKLHEPAKWVAGMGFAGIVIAGAVGLAQPNKNETKGEN